MDDPKFTRYKSMKKMGIPVHALKQKMVMDGISEDEANAFLGIKAKPKVIGPPPGAPPGAITPEKLAALKAEFQAKHEAAKVNEKYKPYMRMQKMGIPPGALRNRMIKVKHHMSVKVIPACCAYSIFCIFVPVSTRYN